MPTVGIDVDINMRSSAQRDLTMLDENQRGLEKLHPLHDKNEGLYRGRAEMSDRDLSEGR